MIPALRFTLLLSLLVVPSVARGQGDYYNRDAGRPSRVEDASATPRHELELQIAPVRFEKLGSGVGRWRLEPKLAWGIAPFTEVEVRSPFLVVMSPDSGAATRTGSGGIAIGALHAFGLERERWPAVALSAEWLAPTGALSASVGSYLVKAIATKTFDVARAHVNIGYGTYSTRLNVCAQPRPINIPAPPGCPPGPIPFDPPCDRIPDATALCAAPALVQRREEDTFDVTRSVGMRWLAAFGVDRTFPLRSTLVSADVVAERFAGLFLSTDVSAELGMRHQLTPLFVVDLGVARHFNGLLRSNSISLGIGYGISLAGTRQ
jgi:hypothetical protein